MNYKRIIQKFKAKKNELIYKIKYFITSDVKRTKKRFKKRFGYVIDLNKPVTFNEKIQWLKINDKNPLRTKCADKYEVREYVKSKISDKHLVPLYFVTEFVDDIKPENIPHSQFIIKATHDSGSSFTVHDKEKVDWIELRKKLEKAVTRNYYYSTQEWHYKNIKPRIIVEKLLVNKNKKVLDDYKLHCFNGKVELIAHDVGRGEDGYYKNMYDKYWNKLPLIWGAIVNNKKITPSKTTDPKPELLELMVKNSEILAQDFNYVRVDWYIVNQKLYFGEITFHAGSGFSKLEPAEWSKKLGDKIVLPIDEK